MKLFFLEYKKMVCSRAVLMLILVLLAVNFGKNFIYIYYNAMLQESLTKRNDSAYRAYEGKYEGEITEEKAKEIIKGYQANIGFMQGTNEYNEEDSFCYRIYPLYKYQYTYHLMIQKLLDEATENEFFFQEKNNPSQAELNSLIQKVYSGRQIGRYYNSEDFKYLFEYMFSTLLLVFFALILSFRFFYAEKQSKTYQMLISLGKKRRKVFAVKYTSLFSGIFSLGVILYLQDYIIYWKMLNLNGGLNPVYAIESYKYSPFNIPIIGYYILVCAARIAIVFLIALIFVAVEQMFSGRVVPAAVGGLAAVCVIFTGDKYLNLGSYGKGLHTIRLWNHVYPAAYIGLSVYLVLLIIFTLLVYVSFKICR